MSSNPPKKRVRFSKQDVDLALNPRLPEENPSARDTFLPRPDEDELPQPRVARDEEGPIKSTNPEFAASLRARHRKEIDNLKVGEAVDISLPDDVALAEEAEDRDDEQRFTEDGIPIEPFNLRAERAEGFFDVEGNYVAYRGGEDTDAWLETLPAGPIAGQALEMRDGKGAPPVAGTSVGDEQRPEMTQHDRTDYRQRILRTLQPGETVLGALRRLGAPEDAAQPSEQPLSTSAQKLSALRAKLAGRVPEGNRASFDRITADASQLLNAGDTEIYSATREQIAADLLKKQGRTRRHPASLGSNGVALEAAMLTNRLAAPLADEMDVEEGEPPSANPSAPVDPDEDIFGGETIGPTQISVTPNLESGAQGRKPSGRESEPSNSEDERRQTDSSLAGFAFDEGSGMFYNTELGCYFDAKRQLYGDAASGRWYSYREGEDSSTERYDHDINSLMKLAIRSPQNLASYGEHLNFQPEFKGAHLCLPLMADLQSTSKLFEDLKIAIKRDDLSAAKQRLTKLKLNLTQLPALPPRLAQTKTAQQELLLAREILEHAVFLSIRQQDEAAFERNFLQLNAYYTDLRHLMPPSKVEHLVIGLNLLRLLVQNRIAEFHTDLELLAPKVQQSEYIRLVTQLEQWLMEGAYNKVLDARKSVPDHSYAYFMEKLLSTVRDEIAGCSEVAYKSLAIPEAKRLLLLDSDSALADYALERGWSVDDGKVEFAAVGSEQASEVPALSVINHTMIYARELERIV